MVSCRRKREVTLETLSKFLLLVYQACLIEYCTADLPNIMLHGLKPTTSQIVWFLWTLQILINVLSHSSYISSFVIFTILFWKEAESSIWTYNIYTFQGISKNPSNCKNHRGRKLKKSLEDSTLTRCKLPRIPNTLSSPEKYVYYSLIKYD